MIQTCSAPQIDHPIFSFVKDIKVGVKKMTRNCHKMIEQTGDSLLLSKHSIQLSALFLLLSGSSTENKKKLAIPEHPPSPLQVLM